MPIDILKQIWPEWSIGKRIGGGAYGTVYEANRNEYGVDNHAAIKIISIPASEAEIDTLRSEGLDMQATKTHFQTIVNDFVNEIRLMVSLEGRPNIVNVKDYKVVEKKDGFGWHIFILMELLIPFVVYTCDHQMTEAEVIKLGCDICTALETCAEEKIIHRDIKPGNILVHKSGDFKLGDFGIARKLANMTGGLSQRYTPKYMAPEVTTSRHYDERVDIYSLGIVLYELLNKKCIPFQSKKQINYFADIEQAVARRNSGEKIPVPCDASPAMADLILRACAYDPDMRFSSATEMKQALMSVANGTYQMATNNLDRTTSVRKAADSYDRTTSVRKAPAASNQKSAPAVNTFGSTPKKKRKMPAVIAAVLAVVLLVGAGIFAVPKLLDGNDSLDPGETSSQTTSETADYSKFNEKQIASIISEAEILAAEEDYEGALVKVETGLMTYPKSAALQDKADEYTESLNAQVKTDAIITADSLAGTGDYLSAIQTIEEAIAVIGEDAELTEKTLQYQQMHISVTIDTATSMMHKKEYVGALAVLNEALQYYPDSKDLKQKVIEIENVQNTIGSATVDNPNQNPVPPKTPEEHDISAATHKSSAVTIEREDIYHASFTTDGDAAWYKFTTSSNYSAYSIQFLNNSIDTTIYVTVYDSYDKELGQKFVNKGNTNYLDITLEANTEYWVKVHRYSGSRMGNYQFAINEKICDAGMSKADSFYVDLDVQYTKALDVRGINDWYKFTATGNYSTYQFALTNNSIDTTLYLKVYDEYNTELGSVSASKGSSAILDLKLTANREYTVQFSRYSSDRNGYYQFSISEMICDAGLTQAEAFPLKLNETLYGIADTAFAEWYVYTFTESNEYTLKLTNNSVNTTLYATVYDVLGTELGFVSASKGNSTEKSLAIEAGTILYIEITRYNSNQFGNYTLYAS